jgi:hypothetical protein
MGDEASPELKERELQLAETRAANERELKQQELALSELKLRQDRELKEQELRIQGRQIAIGRWSGPVAVAVVAGLLGIVGTFFSARENRELERKKQEGTLVLEAIRTGASGKEREQQAAANLVFLGCRTGQSDKRTDRQAARKSRRCNAVAARRNSIFSANDSRTCSAANLEIA